MTAPGTIRVGVLGAGAWAELAHLPGFKRDPRCELVAIADPQVDLARARGRPSSAFPSSTRRTRS